jgi:hypothetical protein
MDRAHGPGSRTRPSPRLDDPARGSSAALPARCPIRGPGSRHGIMDRAHGPGHRPGSTIRLAGRTRRSGSAARFVGRAHQLGPWAEIVNPTIASARRPGSRVERGAPGPLPGSSTGSAKRVHRPSRDPRSRAGLPSPAFRPGALTRPGQPGARLRSKRPTDCRPVNIYIIYILVKVNSFLLAI